MKNVLFTGLLVICLVFTSCGIISNDDLAKMKTDLNLYLSSNGYDAKVDVINITEKRSGDYYGTATVTKNYGNEVVTVSIKASPFFLGGFTFDIAQDQLDLINPDAWKEKDNSTYARSLVEVALEKQYAPRKVQFPGAFDDFVVRKMENQQYIISSYIDVQNDFGVMTRIKYLANMQQTGPGNNDWNMVSFEVLK